MYVVMNRVMLKPAWKDEFIERFSKRQGQIDKEPGFISMQVLRPENAETPFVVLTHWVDKASFKAWVKSDDFKLAHQNPMSKDAFLDGGGLETFELAVSSNST